jgi:hypothetical protein
MLMIRGSYWFSWLLLRQPYENVMIYDKGGARSGTSSICLATRWILVMFCPLMMFSKAKGNEKMRMITKHFKENPNPNWKTDILPNGFGRNYGNIRSHEFCWNSKQIDNCRNRSMTSVVKLIVLFTSQTGQRSRNNLSNFPWNLERAGP